MLDSVESLRSQETLEKYAAKLVDAYLATLPTEYEQRASHIPAYIYLTETYLAYQQKHTPSATLANCKTVLQENLLPGLKRYFDHANDYQDKLIGLTVNAARETLLAEALYTRMNLPSTTQFKPVALEGLFKTKLAVEAGADKSTTLQALIQNTLEIMLPTAEIMLPPADEPLYQELLDAIEHQQNTSGKAKSEAALALRGKISAYLQKLALPEIHVSNAIVEAYKQARKTQTRAFDTYDSLLKERRDAHADQLNGLREKDQSPNRLRLIAAIDALNERIDDIEAFRNGYINILSPQNEMISRIERIADIPTEFRDSTTLKHPLFSQLSVSQRALKNIATNAKDTYKENFPSLDIIENGVKSWRRTIDKLIHEKGGEWTQIKDVSRINIVCDRVETPFYCSQANDRQATTLGWKKDPSPIRITPTSSLNWLSKYTIPTEDGQNWGTEVKFDDRQQRNIEYYTHKIYECIRLIGTKPKELDAATLELNFPRFIKQTHRYISLLHKFNPFPASADIGLQMAEIIATTQKLASDKMSLSTVNPDSRNKITNDLRPKLEALHASLCCEAAKSSSPGMAAFYTALMEDKLDALGKIRASKEADDGAKRAATATTKLLNKAMRDHGPTDIPEQHKIAVEVLRESINPPTKKEGKTR